MTGRTPIVVLGLCPNGLGVVRAAAALGAPVLGIDHQAGKPGFDSRYVTALSGPDPFHEPDALVDALTDLIGRHGGRAVLLPTSDEYVLFLSRHRDRLADRADFVLPEAEVLESLLNKAWQYRKATAAGIDIPRTAYPDEPEGFAALAADMTFPAIVKPSRTHLWKERFPEAKGFRAESADALVGILERVHAAGVEVVVQDLVPGPATAMYEVCSYLDASGAAHGTFIKRKLRQFPCGMGLGSVVESVVDPDLAAAGETLLREIGVRGPGEVEFKLDPRDGRYRMIEVNARLTLQNALSRACGIDYAAMSYAELTGGSVEAPSSYPAGKRWIWLELDFEARKCPGEGAGLGDWLRALGRPDVAAVFSRDDMRPFWGVLGGVARRRWRRLSGRETG